MKQQRFKATCCASWMAGALGLLAISQAGLAYGQPAITPSNVPLDVSIDAFPVLGARSGLAPGWNQVVVEVRTTGSTPAKGLIEITAQRYGKYPTFKATAPYIVGASSAVYVRVPVRISGHGDISVSVVDDTRGEVGTYPFGSVMQGSVVLLDVSKPSRLRGVIHETPILPAYIASRRGMGSSSTGPSLVVGEPRFDSATGDPLLPDRAALYNGADAVVMRSDKLARITGAELDALAGYIMAGGTLAIAMVRPEDMRHPTLVALVGGEVKKTAPSSEVLRPMLPPVPLSAVSGPGKVISPANSPTDAVSQVLSGWAGGNLVGSPYGNSAFYGLGEVHLLAFDPTSSPFVDDPWIQIRMADLARRGHDRRSTIVFRPGGDGEDPEFNQIRQQLDPNESSRWAIGLSALLLCIYAVLAGPLNFSRASKKGKPLRALRHLPIYAVIAFTLIVGIGIAAKGFRGRARHLTLIEAGAGMTKGTARRFRGFFASKSKDLTVRTSDASSIVSTAVAAELSEQRDHLVVDRDGIRLNDVAALPWQTVVVREDGFAALGDGIGLLRDTAGVTVINRSGRNLRGVVLWLSGGADVRYFARIKDGEKVSSSTGVDLGTDSNGRHWIARVKPGKSYGSIDVHALNADDMHRILDADAPGLSDAWSAFEEAAGEGVDWLPDNVPVLLGQLDGGEGRLSDSGLRLESDRLLVRIVGFGGAP